MAPNPKDPMQISSLTSLLVPALISLLSVVLPGCAEPEELPPPTVETVSDADTSPAPAQPGEEVLALRAGIATLNTRAEHGDPMVEVQHILISFSGAGTGATRTQAEAEALAASLFAELQEGADFDALVKEHTDDSHPGIYSMRDNGQPQSVAPDAMPRSNLVPAFGKVGWLLGIGEVGVAPFEPGLSPYGWHLIKRLR